MHACLTWTKLDVFKTEERMTRDGMKEGRRGKQPEAILAEGTGKTGPRFNRGLTLVLRLVLGSGILLLG